MSMKGDEDGEGLGWDWDGHRILLSLLVAVVDVRDEISKR